MLNYQRNYMLYRVLDGFFRNWLVFLVTLVVVSGTVATVLILRSAQYMAVSTIRLGSDEVNALTNALGVRDPVWRGTPAEISGQKFQDLMRDSMPGGFVDRAVKTANLAVPINTDPRAKDERYKSLLRGVSVKALSNSVIQLVLTWPDKDECEKLVNALEKEFIRQAELDSSAASEGTRGFLAQQVEVFRKKMQKAEQSLVDFKKDNSGLLPDALTGQIDALTTLRMQRDSLEIGRKDAQLKLDALRKRLAEIKPVSVLEQRVANDPAIFEARNLYAQRAERIRSGWLPSSPMVVEIDEKLKQIENDIRKRQAADPTSSKNVTESILSDNPEYREIQQQIVSAEIESNTQDAQISALDSRIGSYEAIIAKLPVQERTLTEKTRDYKLLQAQFEDLVKRQQEANIKRDLGVVTARSQFNPMNVVVAESLSSMKKKAVAIATSLAVGIVLALCLVLLREWMDPSVRYEIDAARLLELPVLVSLPETNQLRFPVRGKLKSLGGRSTRAIGGNA